VTKYEQAAEVAVAAVEALAECQQLLQHPQPQDLSPHYQQEPQAVHREKISAALGLIANGIHIQICARKSMTARVTMGILRLTMAVVMARVPANAVHKVQAHIILN